MATRVLSIGVAVLLLASGCTKRPEIVYAALTEQDIRISLESAKQDKDGFPHAFRVTFENKSDHEGILELHGALPGGRGYIIPSSLWLGFTTPDGRELTLAHTYGKTPKGERVQLKASERLVREYPTADFCLWGPAADTGPNEEYAFGKYFQPGQKEVRVQAACIVGSAEDRSVEPARAYSEAITMRCSYDESLFPQEEPGEPAGTALHQAVRRGDVAEVERLLAQGADVNAKGEYGSTPLHVAAEKGDVKIAEMLLAKGATLDDRVDYAGTPLRIAAVYGNVEVMRLLIAKGADVEAREPLGGSTPLHDAALQGQLEAATLLVETGADPNAKDSLGDTPLCFAALKGYGDVVALLLDKGADVNCGGHGGLTPLHYAAGEGHKSVVELLLARGAKPNIKDERGETPLAWAEECGRKDTVLVLKQHGVEE